MVNGIRIEIACGTIDDVITCTKYPVDRIELTMALELGSLTPSVGELKRAKEVCDIPMACMVRPRGGSLWCSDENKKVMLMDAEELLKAGADGIVFGFIDEKTHEVEKDWTKKMVELVHSYGKEAVFHKASDKFPDYEKGIQDLIECGVDRVLTSAGKAKAELLDGCAIIKQMKDKYGDKIQFLPGGGISKDNIKQVVEISGADQLHMTCKGINEKDSYTFVDGNAIAQFLDALK